MNRRTWVVAASVFALFAQYSSTSRAAIMVYTDRATWQGALSGQNTLVSENFSSLPLGTLVLPSTTFPSGVVFDGPYFQITNAGFSTIGQGQGLLVGTSAGPNVVTMPGDVFAFGFDYADRDTLLETFLVIDGVQYLIPLTGDIDAGVTPDDFGFLGFIGTSSADLPGGQFGLITSTDIWYLDNLTFVTPLVASQVVPEPTSLSLLILGLVAAGAGFRKTRTRRED